MHIEKRIPNVYGQHALIEQAVQPFLGVAGRLVVSEYSDSLDWWFTITPANGERKQAVLLVADQMLPKAELVGVIRDGIIQMLKA